jgi:phosphohistidine phosphatase SixA
MRWTALIAFLAFAAGCATWPFGRPVPPTEPVTLVEALRAGGHVVYLRHADTEFWHRDAASVVLEDCATQRNLSATGREQARAIGVGLARLLVPVGEVRSSPYCRCAETARLAFDRVLLDADLTTLDDADAAQRAAREAALRRLLGTLPAPGTNTVLVSHIDNFAAVGGTTLGEGEAAVLKPLPDGGFQLVARVPAEAWSTMPSPAAAGPKSLSSSVPAQPEAAN